MITLCFDILLLVLAMCAGVWVLKLGLAAIASIGTLLLTMITFRKEDKKP